MKEIIINCPYCDEKIKLIKKRNGEYVAIPFLVNEDTNNSPTVQELSNVGIELGIIDEGGEINGLRKNMSSK